MKSTPPPYEPITLRDVLRAIFLPVSEEQAPEIIFPSFHPFPLPEKQNLDDVTLSDLEDPAVISYTLPAIEGLLSNNPKRIAITGIGTIATILLAYFAQSAAGNLNGGFGSGLFYVIAVAFWLGLVIFDIAPPDGGLLRRGPTTRGGGTRRALALLEDRPLTTRMILGTLGVVLSLATYVFAAGNLFTLPAVISWVASLLVWMIVLAERNPEALISAWGAWLRDVRRHLSEWLQPRALPIAAFIIIMGISIFFRVYRLDSIPNEMTSDHVEKLLDSYDVSRGITHVFFTRNGGREAIQFYVVPLIAQLFGTGMSFLSLKIASVLEALALIPLMIVLGHEVVDQETGFFAAALLAISWWHIALGRLALRIVLTPLLFTPLLLTLIRGMRTGSRRSWLWAGFWMGIGVYGYQALRITPLVAIAAFVLTLAGPLWRVAQSRLRRTPATMYEQIVVSRIAARQGLNLIFSGIVALVIFVPMLRAWHDFPNEVWNRVINRTTDSEVALQGSANEIFFDNFGKALRMFNVRGDGSWFTAVPDAPMMDVITGSLLILGFAAWLVRLRVRRDPVDAFLLAAGLIMLLPSALSIAFPIENPSATRASGVIPIVYLIAAWPLSLIRQRWRAVMGKIPGTVLAAILISTLYIAAGVMNYHSYFVLYADSYRKSALNPGEVAGAVRAIIGPEASLDGVWLEGWPFWHDYRAIGIDAGDITFHNAIVDTTQLTSFLQDFPANFAIRPLVFIVNPLDTEAIKVLQSEFPDGEARQFISRTEGRDFVLFVVPRN